MEGKPASDFFGLESRREQVLQLMEQMGIFLKILVVFKGKIKTKKLWHFY